MITGPVGVPAVGDTTNVKVWVVLDRNASVTVKFREKVPAAVGVPLITPELRESPAGSENAVH